jgi:hypothetical protein
MINARGGNKKARRARDTIRVEQGLLTGPGVSSLIGYVCIESRNSYCCPNNFECGSTFSRKGGVQELQTFRRPFWDSKWKSHLIESLQSASSLLDEARCISYQISGIRVCKSFYRAATGLSRQVFDAAVYRVVNHQAYPSAAREFANRINVRSDSHSETVVCGFLDAYFTGFRVQYDPACDNKAMLYKTWKELYDTEFKFYCDESGIEQISYPHFCRIRKLNRKQYVIAKSYRRKGIILYLMDSIL